MLNASHVDSEIFIITKNSISVSNYFCGIQILRV